MHMTVHTIESFYSTAKFAIVWVNHRELLASYTGTMIYTGQAPIISILYLGN